MLRYLLASGLLCLLALSARADEGEARHAARQVDLSALAVEPSVVGPRLAVPTDLIAADIRGENTRIWRLDDATTWLAFSEPSLERFQVGPETLAEVLRLAAAQHEVWADKVDISCGDDHLWISGLPEAVEAVSAHLPWTMANLAPRVRVDAVLSASVAGEDARLQAMGGVELAAGRWTRVYLQERELACVPMWHIEVAQEATVMDPVPVGVPEGRELYVRYHPGETVSLIEVWAGDVTHTQLLRADLSAIRNVPEANGPGVATFPLSAVRRTYTQLVVPAAQESTRELRWSLDGVRTRLVLNVSAATAPATTLDRGPRTRLALLRAGATTARLEFEARAGAVEFWTDRASGLLHRAGLVAEAAGRMYEYSVSPVEGGAVVLAEAPVQELESLRADLAASEAALRTGTVHVQLLTVPEAAWRGVLEQGRVRIGSALDPAVLAMLREAGASAGDSFSSPVLVGTPLGFRVGRSRPGVIDYNPEIAQQAAGLHPVTSARFEGLFGEVRVRAQGDGYAARVRGAYCEAWTHNEALELTIRPPVGMGGPKDGAGTTPSLVTRVRLPVLAGGHVAIGREVALPAGASGEVLVHAHVRGEEVVLLLLAFQP